MSETIAAAPAAPEAPISSEAPVISSAPGATPVQEKAPAPVSTKKKYKIKVDKNEEELEFDPHNDEEVTKHLQMSRASQKRMNEASEIRKAALDFITELKKNPRKVLSDPSIGVDVKKFAEQIMNEQIAELEKTPEQRKQEDMEKRLADAEAKAKQFEEDNKTKEFQRLQAEHERQLTDEISAALDVGGIPKTPRTVARMAEMMMIALTNNIDLSVKDIVPIVKNHTMTEFKEIMGALSDDQLEDFIGKEVIGRIRKKNVSKMKAETANQVKSTGQEKKKEVAPDKKLTIRQFLGA